MYAGGRVRAWGSTARPDALVGACVCVGAGGSTARPDAQVSTCVCARDIQGMLRTNTKAQLCLPSPQCPPYQHHNSLCGPMGASPTSGRSWKAPPRGPVSSSLARLPTPQADQTSDLGFGIFGTLCGRLQSLRRTDIGVTWDSLALRDTRSWTRLLPPYNRYHRTLRPSHNPLSSTLTTSVVAISSPTTSQPTMTTGNSANPSPLTKNGRHFA